MTDIQEIRRLLDERGVDYDEYPRINSHAFAIDYCDACGDYLSEIEIFGACIYATKKYLTPEQAIAATLGSDKLTAEQVEKVIMSSDYWERVNNHPSLREGVWQAIADELNAELEKAVKR